MPTYFDGRPHHSRQYLLFRVAFHPVHQRAVYYLYDSYVGMQVQRQKNARRQLRTNNHPKSTCPSGNNSSLYRLFRILCFDGGRHSYRSIIFSVDYMVNYQNNLNSDHDQIRKRERISIFHLDEDQSKKILIIIMMCSEFVSKKPSKILIPIEQLIQIEDRFLAFFEGSLDCNNQTGDDNNIFEVIINNLQKKMGQNCCSASENSPQIKVNNEELSEETAQKKTLTRIAQKQKQTNEMNQKQKFYGKDGHVHSKTITKEMASRIDQNLEQYKKKILSKQSTINEQIEEDTVTDRTSAVKGRKSKEQERGDVFDQFLQNLADQISNSS